MAPMERAGDEAPPIDIERARAAVRSMTLAGKYLQDGDVSAYFVAELRAALGMDGDK